MRKKILCALLLGALPCLANATDITIKNNTDSYGTGFINTLFKTCSSTLGERGVLQPHQDNFHVPGSIIKTFCGSQNCEAYIFKTQNCGGDKIAIVTINASEGVISINNMDPKNYAFVGGGDSITINSPNQHGFVNWVKSFF